VGVDTRTDVQIAAKLFRGLGDPTRLAILQALAETGELRVKDLCIQLDAPQSTISGHVGCLKECGLVTDRPVGRQVYYRISGPEVVAAIRSAEDVLTISGHRIELCANYRVGP
jgi:DNA-binding transcriptional ArsR family regulator